MSKPKFTREQLEAQLEQLDSGAFGLACDLEAAYMDLGDEFIVSEIETIDTKRVAKLTAQLQVQSKAYNDYVKLLKSITKTLKNRK